MPLTRKAWLLVLITATGLPLAAQQSAPAFEVASVKRAAPAEPTDGIVGRSDAPGVFSRIGSVANLIQFGYELQEYQVIGGPPWVRQDRFAVAARAGREVTRAELRFMVRSLLKERFKLVAHPEQREMSSYALVLSRSDKRLGPRLKKNDDDCKSLVEAPTGVPSGAVRAAGCGTMAMFVNTGPSRQMGAPVIDATGLVGMFQWSYYYDAAGGFLGRGIEPDAVTVDLPQYSTALEEQLGLKLEPRRRPVPVIVIDSVQPPTPD